MGGNGMDSAHIHSFWQEEKRGKTDTSSVSCFGGEASNIIRLLVHSKEVTTGNFSKKTCVCDGNWNLLTDPQRDTWIRGILNYFMYVFVCVKRKKENERDRWEERTA